MMRFKYLMRRGGIPHNCISKEEERNNNNIKDGETLRLENTRLYQQARNNMLKGMRNKLF